jgi:hypothetical protein
MKASKGWELWWLQRLAHVIVDVQTALFVPWAGEKVLWLRCAGHIHEVLTPERFQLRDRGVLQGY